MRSSICCWLSLLTVATLTIPQSAGLFVPDSANAVGSKSDHWRRAPDGLVLAQPNIIIEQRDIKESSESSSSGHPMARDVWDPKITSPAASTVWKRGSVVTVTWDTSDAPQYPTSIQGKLYLGHMSDGETNEHLDINHPLAQGVNLNKGSAQVTVPADVSPGADYIIVLMGDSGNRSQKFTIQ